MKDVTEPRNTNTTLFITVLCACLGLLTISVPAEARTRQAADVSVHYGAAGIHLRLAASAVSSLQALKTEDRWLPDSAAPAECSGKAKRYPDSTVHTEINQILLVTHLARAGLSADALRGETA
jgi:hypothetical protein